VLDISVEINKSPSTTDDVVQVKCDHPPRSFKVPCTIKLIGPATAPVKVILFNPDLRLGFPDGQDVELLPNNVDGTDFEITGEKASKKIGDAKIQVQGPSAVDGFVAEKKVTVFSFDQAQILVKQGSNYKLAPLSVGQEFIYAPVPGSAVDISAKARLRPAGLDCTIDQIFPLRVAIMQEVSGFRSTTTWDRPIIEWGPGFQDGDTFEVERVTRVETTWDSTVKQPVNDNHGESNDVFLLSILDSGLKPPTGCDGAEAAVSSSSPFTDHIKPTISRTFGLAHGDAKVTWTRLVNTTLERRFRTFCVVFNLVTREFCALRQTTWTLNVASNGPPANQHAVVRPRDAAASADPAMPPPTNETATKDETKVAVGTAKKKFNFPKTS
jgi:hypothetical protein